MMARSSRCGAAFASRNVETFLRLTPPQLRVWHSTCLCRCVPDLQYCYSEGVGNYLNPILRLAASADLLRIIFQALVTVWAQVCSDLWRRECQNCMMYASASGKDFMWWPELWSHSLKHIKQIFYHVVLLLLSSFLCAFHHHHIIR